MNHALSEQFFKSSERQGEVGQEHHDAFILGALWAMEYFDRRREIEKKAIDENPRKD